MASLAGLRIAASDTVPETAVRIMNSADNLSYSTQIADARLQIAPIHHWPERTAIAGVY